MRRTARHLAMMLTLSSLAACANPAPPPPVVMPPPAAAAVSPPLPEATAPPEAAASLPDRQFVSQALIAGHREVALGRVARAKATRQEVRAYAGHLVDDYAAIDRRLAAIARRQNIVLPDSPTSTRATRARLAAGGAALDTLYIHGQVRRQRALIDLFEGESRHGENPALKNFASEILPNLHRHLRRAEALAGTTGG